VTISILASQSPYSLLLPLLDAAGLARSVRPRLRFSFVNRPSTMPSFGPFRIIFDIFRTRRHSMSEAKQFPAQPFDPVHRA